MPPLRARPASAAPERAARLARPPSARSARLRDATDAAAATAEAVSTALRDARARATRDGDAATHLRRKCEALAAEMRVKDDQLRALRERVQELEAAAAGPAAAGAADAGAAEELRDVLEEEMRMMRAGYERKVADLERRLRDAEEGGLGWRRGK